MKHKGKRVAALAIAAALTLSVSVFATNETGPDNDHGAEPGVKDIAHFTAKNTYTENTFTDVPSGAWYEADVKRCYELGLMSGAGGDKFNPDGTVTLAEAVMMASRVHNIYNGGDGNIGTADNWINAAVDFGKLHALFTDDDFQDYKQPATRAQIAYLFANTMPKAEFIPINSIEAFPGVSSDTRYLDKLLILSRAGVLTGDQNGNINPAANITRKEVAAVINRVVTPASRLNVSFE